MEAVIGDQSDTSIYITYALAKATFGCGISQRHRRASRGVDSLMTVYFTSDHHFGHAAARSFYRRPFSSLAEMDQVMADRWNVVVRPEDEVWHLGDFAVRQSADRVAYLLTMLQGRKHLVCGNNDNSVVIGCPIWHSVQSYAEVVIEGRKLILCHYPFRTWRDMAKGAVNLHGHSHGRLRSLPRQFDVGVDVWGFVPVSFAKIVSGRRNQPVLPRRSRLDPG
jgi:calcineurin-like phosphoesterase family protein